MLATYLQRREPGLIVLSYGTNEASDPLWHRESYREAFAKVIERLRLSAPCRDPGAGTRRPAGCARAKAGNSSPVSTTSSSSSNRSAVSLAASDWDARKRMGGAGSDSRLATRRARPGRSSSLHLSLGYRRLASVLFSDLMQALRGLQEGPARDRESDRPRSLAKPCKSLAGSELRSDGQAGRPILQTSKSREAGSIACATSPPSARRAVSPPDRPRRICPLSQSTSN